MRKWLTTFAQRLPCKKIFHTQDDGTVIPILERYNLLSKENGPGLVLHRFVNSDPDRGLHDHPWTFGVSIILAGSYKELKVTQFQPRAPVQVTQHVYRPGHVNIINGTHYHRVLLETEDVWTLFFHWKRTKIWGFLKQQDDMVDNWHYNAYAKEIVDLDGAWWKKVQKQ